MNAFLESSTEYFATGNDDSEQRPINEKQWEWGLLRVKCRNFELEEFYQAYMQRLRVSYLSLFIAIDAVTLIVQAILLFATVQQTSDIYMDVAIYAVADIAAWLILSINFRESLIRRHTWIRYVSSWLAVTVKVLSDISVPVYHSLTRNDTLRPTFSYYMLYAVYIFMPMPDNVHAIILGLATTVSYLISFALVTYRKRIDNTPGLDITKIISEGIFLLCINLLGVYFRMMQEITIRTTFLDRQQCVEETLALRLARDQENSLLLSIIPAQIASKIEQDVRMRIEHSKSLQTAKRDSLKQDPNIPPLKVWRRPEKDLFRKLFIEPHNDVSILYADVVNYTYLTTTLDVKTLVETLHDLFVSFDTASEAFNVLRIKFLGDCYYCVSGVPVPNEYHAKCCVELGLQMIKAIRDVRVKRKLDIDMRIGVHSGDILSGVIGACKWQFDIWSKDVDIANRLEQTGMAGRVHVSEQTLNLLDGEYMYEEGTIAARTDQVLQKYQIRTYLIKPPKELLYRDYRSSGILRQIENRNGINRNDFAPSLYANNRAQFNQLRVQAKLEMSRELDKMPIGRIQVKKFCFNHSQRLTQDEMEEQNFRRNITSLFLFFKNIRWEVMFMREPDVMLKYSIFSGVVIFFATLVVQAINYHQSPLFWMLTSFFVVVILLTLFVSWYKKIWIMYISETEMPKPTNKYSSMLYRLSERMQGSIVVRIAIYLLLMIMQLSCALLQLLDCNPVEVDVRAATKAVNIEYYTNDLRDYLCFNPWAVTESIMLAICMCFLFTRVPFVLKLCTGIVLVIFYAIIVNIEYSLIYENSRPTNVGLYSEYSHMMMVLITVLIFHLMDRQTEFISKVDYNWKRQLKTKQDDAKFTNNTIKTLIHTILPTHVADIYMSKRMRNELYYEEYDNVAVMFATIRNYDTEKVGLRVLNEIICDFDEVLDTYMGSLKIEKIKVAGWTYMAACGLDVERSEHVNTSHVNFRNSSLLPNGRRSQYHSPNRFKTQDSNSTDKVKSLSAFKAGLDGRHSSRYEGHHSSGEARSRKISSPQQNNVVYVMAKFALDLMRTLHSFNIENLQCEDGKQDPGMLRIGISNGEIMAGVVGSYKPHYDIWGNPVNMASRMDSTGLPGRIHVTEETAEILQTFNIKCTFRGLTYVKGRGEIPTYFIDVDENMDFVKINPTNEKSDTNKKHAQ